MAPQFIIKGILINFSLLVLAIYVLHSLLPWLGERPGRKGILWRSVGPTVGYSLASALAMAFPLELAPGVLWDLRHLPVGLAGYYRGPGTGLAVAALVFAYRLWLGGSGAIPSIVLCLCPLATSFVAAQGARIDPSQGQLRWPPGVTLLTAGIAVAIISGWGLYWAQPQALRFIWVYHLLITVVGFISMGYLITSEREKQEKISCLKVEARIDFLTGLANRRLLEERLQEEIARTQRTGRPFSLLMLDLDGFKYYNDSFGHSIGDQVLQLLSAILSQSVREMDLVARYGGEEFVVLLPETQLESACAAAERLRQQVETGSRAQGQPMTVSIGVATFPQDGETGAELVAAADRAMYLAKGKGRNRVVAAD